MRLAWTFTKAELEEADRFWRVAWRWHQFAVAWYLIGALAAETRRREEALFR